MHHFVSERTFLLQNGALWIFVECILGFVRWIYYGHLHTLKTKIKWTPCQHFDADFRSFYPWKHLNSPHKGPALRKACPLQWRHNERHGVSNYRRLHCLLNCWYRPRSKKTSKLASLASVWGIHWWLVKSPHKRPVTRKMFLFDDVIMSCHDIIIVALLSVGRLRARA